MVSTRLDALVLGSALAAGQGCYQEPGVVSSEEVVQLSFEPATGAVADGKSIVELVATVDGRTPSSQPITFTTSDGVLNFATDAADKKSIQRSGPRQESESEKSVFAKLQVGRTPGPILVSASISGIVDEEIMELQSALPDAVFAAADMTTLRLDGTSRASLTVTLKRSDGMPSFGTLVTASACCADDGGIPVSCKGRPPLAVPAFAELTSGDQVTLQAITQSITAEEAGSDAAYQAVVVLRAYAGGTITPGGETCEDISNQPLATSVVFHVSPIP